MFRKTPAPSILLATGDPRGGAYSLRVSSLAMSIGVHATMIVLLGAVPRGSTFQSDMPAFRPQDHKIVYYDFRKKQTPVAPRTGQSSPKAPVASRPKPAPAKPQIRVPAPQIKQAETMIARLNATRPQLPAPPPVPKIETPKPAPPEEGVKIARKQAKTFAPPPPASPVKPRLALPTPVLEESAPALTNQSVGVRLAAGAGRSAISLGAAPALDAPPTPTVSTGTAGTEAILASVNSGERLVLPGADRADRSSGSAKEGPPSSGDTGKAGTRDTGIGVGEPKPKPPDVAPAMKAVLYSEKVRMGPPASLSVPLRPGARTLPRNIEARFQARNVFTMVVPIENFPGYGGDWIIWFAEKQAGGTSAPAMRAPVPFRKMEPIDQPAGERTSVRVQVAGILAADGRLGSISFLSTVTPGVEQAVVQDLQNWEFRPAARANTPAEVEIVFEIPYSLPVAVARR